MQKIFVFLATLVVISFVVLSSITPSLLAQEHETQANKTQANAIYLPWITNPGQADEATAEVLVDETDLDTLFEEVENERLLTPVSFAEQQNALESSNNTTILLTNSPPAIDGKVDKLWNSTPSQPLQQLILGGAVSSRDLAGSFKAQYDANNLYLLVTVSDDAKRKDSATQWWEDDGIEIYLDGDKSGGTSYDGVNDYQLGFRWNDPMLNIGPNSKAAPAGIRWRRVNTSSGYRLEVAIPLAAVGINPPSASGSYEFGLDVQINEDDDGGTRENKLAWNASADEAWQNPSFFGLASLGVASSTPKTYYVSDASGNDGNSGFSESNAFKTLQHAADQTLPGDTVLVMNGEYTLDYQDSVLRITRSGRADAWISYKAYPGHRPLIQNANYWDTVEIKANYIIFDGFDVRGVNARYTLDQARANFEDYIHNRYPDQDPQIPGLMGHGITTNAFNIIRKNRVFQQGGTGIASAQTGPSDYLLIEDNVVYENAWYSAFCESGINIWQPRHANGGPTNWLDGSQYKIIVRRNIAHRNYNYFPCSDEDEHGNQWTTVTDGNGIILDRFDNVSFPNEPDYNEPVLVENNITYNNGGAGILAFYVEHADIVNNVAYHNGQHPDLKPIRSGIFINQSGSGVNVINNIVVASPGELLTYDNGSRGQIIHYDYNLYYADGGNTILQHKQGAHDRVADPRFVLPSTDPTKADFHLRDGSPAIDSGSDTYLPSLDAEGIQRVAGAVNRGAYERVGDAVAPSVAQLQSTQSAPLIDGEVDTLWNNATTYPVVRTVLGNPVPASDLSARYKALYDANNLYLLVDVIDDAKRNDSATQWWEDDGIEIYLDGNKSRGSSYDGVNDYQLVFRWNDANLNIGPNSKAAPTGLQRRLVDTANGYRLEVAIPLVAVGINPVTGYEFGLDVHVNEDDDGGTRDNKISWNASVDEAWRNPSFFGMAVLQAATVSNWVATLPSAAQAAILWHGDVEEGTLIDWTDEGAQYPGGGIFNTGEPEVVVRAATDVSHSGRFAAEATITNAYRAQNGNRAVRLFRWTDRAWDAGGQRFPTDAYYSTWIYFPVSYNPNKYAPWDPGDGGWWDLFQFKSRDANDVSKPVWSLQLGHDDTTGAMSFYFYTEHNTPASYVQTNPIPIPVGKWVHLEARYRQHAAGQGLLQFWQDGQMIFDIQNVTTKLVQPAEWSLNSYTNHIAGGPVEGTATIYFDDAVVSTQPLHPFVKGK